MTKVLQTKMVGYTTDRTGHVMAPQEIVYQCEEPRQPRTTWFQRIVVLGSLIGCIWIFAGAVVQVLF